MTTAPAPIPRARETDAFPCLLFVPVDGSEGAGRALAMAERIARRSGAQIIVLGLAPRTPPPDAAAIQAQLTLAELGLGTVAPAWAVDDEARLTLHLRLLLPMQQRLQAAGVPAVIRMLRDDDPVVQLRGIAGGAPGRHALALSNPLTIRGPLRALTGALLVEPPCTVYVTGLQPAVGSARRGVIACAATVGKILRKRWQRPAC